MADVLNTATDVGDAGPPADSGAPTDERHDRTARYAAWTFAAVIAIALPVILYQGRDQWFALDEWDFLTRRTAGSLDDLMAPHAEHWVTFGVLVYRALWWLVGLRHYWPYQLCVVALHLTAAVLLRAVMCRARVNPWIATAAASLFALFGAGRQDIVFGFQVSFTGALAFGLAHMLLADHDGRFDRRDLFGIGFGLLALMCSGVGIMMALGVGIAAFMRRGWRMAVAHTAPLAGALLLWSAVYRRDVLGGPKAHLGDALTFAREVFVAAFNGLGQVPGVGALLGLVVVVGVPLALSGQTLPEIRRFDGPTMGLAVAALGFIVTTSYTRATEIPGLGQFSSPAETRYLHIVAALLLPTVALAASAFVDRWRIALPAAIALLVVGVPSNVAALHASGDDAVTLGYRDLVLTMANLPLAREVPGDEQPLAPPSFRIDWLLDGVASGRVPEPSSADPSAIAAAELFLSVYQTNDVPKGTCTPIEPGIPVEVRPGDAIAMNSPLVTVRRRIGGRVAAVSTYNRVRGETLRIVGMPLELVVRTTPANKPAELCR